jgi:hypothetical protein
VGTAAEFEAVVGSKTIETDDLILMAARVKRDLEQKAREAEDRAEHAMGHAKANKEAAADIDVDCECDSAKLQAALEAAVRHEEQLRAKDRHAGQVLTEAERASAALEDAAAEYSGPNPMTAKTQLDMCYDAVEKSRQHVAAVREQLAKAEKELQEDRQAQEHAERVLSTALSHEKVVAQFRQQVSEAKSIQRVPGDELAKATEAVTGARQALERGVLIRKAKEQLAAAEQSSKVAGGHRMQAAKLREAAKGTDEVLSAVVAKTGSRLRVEAGRLVLDTKRGVTYFADLSHGERWKIALDIAIEAVGEGGLLTCPQEAFESLDPDNRRLVHEHLIGSGVVMLTAEADAGELRAEVYQPIGA